MAVGVAVEGQPIAVGGLDPWQLQWKRTDEPEVELPHPSYPGQMHVMGVYEISDGRRTVRFAAGELSANVYGFYVPRQ